jgi:MraZ protein
MASFYGTEPGTLDKKRRLSVPVSVRHDSSVNKTHQRFFLKYGSEGCLQLYSPDEWHAMEEKLRKLLKGDRDERDFVTRFIKDASWVTVDGQGRLTIPSSLQERAGLSTDVVLHGNLDYIAIWNAERFAQRTAVESDDKLAADEKKYLLKE